jgi:hypothetical protein
LVFVRTPVKARRERETRERAEHRCSGARAWTGSLTSGEYLEGTYLPYRQGWERSLAVSCSFCMLHAPPTPRPWDPLAAEIPGPDEIAFSPRRAFCGTIFIQLGCGCLARMLPKAHPLACNACNSWRYFVAPSQCATRRVLSTGIAATQPSGLCLLANPHHSSWSAAAFHDASPFTNKPARAVLGCFAVLDSPHQTISPAGDGGPTRIGRRICASAVHRPSGQAMAAAVSPGLQGSHRQPVGMFSRAPRCDKCRLFSVISRVPGQGQADQREQAPGSPGQPLAES